LIRLCSARRRRFVRYRPLRNPAGLSSANKSQPNRAFSMP
jgi:hypothetical protein